MDSNNFHPKNNEPDAQEEELLALLLAEQGFSSLEMESIKPRSPAETARLSFAQQRLWFLDQLEPGNPAYNIPTAVRLRGELHREALEHSFREIIRRHQALRVTFTTKEGEPVQRLHPWETVAETSRLRVVDLQALPASNREVEARRRAAREGRRPFDLERGPLVRATLLQLAPHDHVLLITLHHTVADGWSVAVFYEELTALYWAFQAGKPSPLPELSIQYPDFAEWQRTWLAGKRLENLLVYWREQLADLPPALPLPTDYPRPPAQEYRQGLTKMFTLSPELADPLRQLSHQSGATLFMILLAAFKLLLYRYTRQADLSVGTLIANRTRSELEPLIGVFINALTLRLQLNETLTFTQLLDQVRETALEAYDHQDMPFETLVERLHPERDTGQTPLFQVMFLLQNMPTSKVEFAGLYAEPFNQENKADVNDLVLDNGTAIYDLVLEMVENPDGGLTGAFKYDAALFEAATIGRMVGHFETLLAGLGTNPEQPIAGLPLLTPAEEEQLLHTWNQTETDFPLAECLPAQFEAQVERTPQAIAATCGGRSLTYRQLNAQANRLAHHLIEAGVGPEVIVALLAERSLEFLTMILAVFKAGGAYLPLDPLHPPQRHRQILDQSETGLVLVSEGFAAGLEETVAQLAAPPRLLRVESLLDQEPAAGAEENPSPRSEPAHLAYVIYTSGSTGRPKGAMVEQRGMLNHLWSKIEDLEITADDILAQNASQCFDISVWQFLAPLLVGGQVHIFPNQIAYDPIRLLRQVEQRQLTLLQVVPSLLRAIIQEAVAPAESRPRLAALRWVVPTGEALTTELARQWLHHYPDIPLLNAYGSTECSDDQCHQPIFAAPPPDFPLPTMPIGRAMANVQVYILDQRLNPVPVGVAGELYVGGTGLGRGYLNDPGRTAEMFIPNPFGQAGERLYKTGDLARYLLDGRIEFLGRVDFMVKIRGFRIELGEIEAALEQHPALHEVVVLARPVESSPGDEPRLVAYLVSNQEPAPTVSELRDHLRQKLPEYMIPSFFVMLDKMPLNNSGKIDRQALPGPEPQEPAESYRPPQTPTQKRLARLWAEVLGRERVGLEDNFFELGGHSLLAVRLAAKIQQEFGRDLPLSALFAGATVERVAQLLEQKNERDDRSPLVKIQAEGDRTPFFCVHPADGTVLSYAALARHLGPEQPFYGLQDVGLSQEQPAHLALEMMAARYVTAMQSIQPEGPYLLGGWSMGSVAAFEMAHQLRRQGQRVGLLALLDHWAPLPGYRPAAAAGPQADAYLVQAFMEDFRRRFAADLPELPDDFQNLELEAQLAYVVEQAELLEQVLPEGGLPQLHQLLQTFKANVQAMWRYTPRVYPGPIHLFQAATQPAEIVAQADQADPALGWDQLSTEPVRVISVPGDHYSILAEPQVQHLAKTLGEALVEAQQISKGLDSPIGTEDVR